jgi:hypothetical protein
MKRILIIPCILLMTSCDKPACNNQNAVFNSSTAGSIPYNSELVKQLQTQRKDDIKYYIRKYEARGNKEFMHVEVQAKAMCAVAFMDITGNERLENYRRVKGMSYQNAGLAGLKYRIVPNDSSYSFVFDDVEPLWIETL